MIGGKNQDGNCKIDCRFNKANLIKLVSKIAFYRQYIELYNLDALDFINIVKRRHNQFYFIDPPYYQKGKELYTNFYTHQDHVKLAKYFKKNIFRSMKFRIILLVALAGIVPVLIMRGVFLTSYEKRAVEVRTAEIQNQCTILSNQLSSSGYLTGDTSETIRTELVQLSNIYSGRVMVIDGNFKIQEDTYEMDEGKTIVSGNVIRCFKEKGTSEYNKKNRYIEVTAPILGKDDSIVGVLLVSAPTDSVLDSLEILRNKADVVALASILVILMIAVLSGMAMLKPFKRITESISAVTEGYDDDYLHENTYTETMELSEAFNKMSGRMKTLDDSRNEFVSNVSHELKTPLTSMKVQSRSNRRG